MRIEIFHGDNEQGLMQEVNAWLDKDRTIEIVEMVQSVCEDAGVGSRSIYLTFLYRINKPADERVMPFIPK